MTERKKTHLIYIDKESYVWMGEHGVGATHPENAEFFCEVPSNDDKRWIEGKPYTPNVQFLTLCPFYPSQRLDVSVEINREPKVMRHSNHPAFEGCVKYMPVHLLDFKPIPKHIPLSIHTIGLCYYGKQEPYKTVEVEHDSKSGAMEKGREMLKPDITEHITYVGNRPNEAYGEHYNKKPKLKV